VRHEKRKENCLLENIFRLIKFGNIVESDFRTRVYDFFLKHFNKVRIWPRTLGIKKFQICRFFLFSVLLLPSCFGPIHPRLGVVSIHIIKLIFTVDRAAHTKFLLFF
jgi:hypothetical protein